MEKVITQLADLDFVAIIIGIFVILESIKLITELISWICNRFGIESKFINDKNKEKQLLKQTSEDLKTVINNQKMLNDKYDKTDGRIDEINKRVDEMSNELSTLNKSIKTHSDVIVDILYHTISEKCDYYINTLHGIPSNEIEILGQLGNSYNSMNGNHGLKNKIDYCLSGKLRVLPIDTDIEK